MQTAQQILADSRRSNVSSAPTLHQSAPSTASSSTSERMKNFWLRMTKLFGSRWSSQFGDCDDGTWASALRGVTTPVLADAIGRIAMSGREFPPSLPEFLAICARAAGLPDAADAYADACHSRWSHPVVYEAARRIGVHELRTRAERDMLPKWREQFGAVCAQWMRGDRWESPTVAELPNRAVRKADRAVACRHIENMRGLLRA